MYKVKVYITLKESVLDTQGNIVKDALHQLSFPQVNQVRVGKYIELLLEQDIDSIPAAVTEMCTKLLANVVIEDYRFEIEEV